AEHVSRDAPGSALHVGGGAPRERQQQDAARIDSAHDEMGDAMRQRVGLAGARARDDQQGEGGSEVVAAMLDRATLLVVEPLEIDRGHASPTSQQRPMPWTRSEASGLATDVLLSPNHGV